MSIIITDKEIIASKNYANRKMPNPEFDRFDRAHVSDAFIAGIKFAKKEMNKNRKKEMADILSF